MKRWQKLLLGVLLVVGLAAAIIFFPISVNLDTYRNLGDNYDVRILRDTWGVPHIFGTTDADAAFGLAYAHAEDDFSTLQLTLLAARGQLGSVFGADGAPNDYMVQLLRIQEQVNEGYDSLSPEMQEILQAYADGMNLYAALHEDEVYPGLFPMNGQDMVAAAVHKTPLFFGLDGALGELFAEERQNTVSPRPGEAWLPYQPGAPNPYFAGSNTFAVAPNRTSDGSTYLLVNAHQPYEGALTFYEAHIHSEEGWDAVGGLIPGMPTIAHGHNRHIGWAFTVNSPDLIDTYVLEINPDNPDQYRFDGEWRDLEVREATLRVKIAGRLIVPVKRELLWSVYGPVVRQDHGTYAIRYAMMGRVGLFEQLFRMNKATNLAEMQEAMGMLQFPMFNMGYADDQGNIAYLYNAVMPLRAEGYDWRQYLPGDTSETLWTEYVPFDQLPFVLNPPSGFIQNGNSTPFQTTIGPGNPDPADFSLTWGLETHQTNRALQALALLGGDESITWDEFKAMKFDLFYHPDSDMAQYVSQIVGADLPDEADVHAAAALLASWDLQTNPDSTGASLAILTALQLNETVPGFNASRMVGQPVDTDVLVANFVEAVHYLKEHFGRVDVAWSEVNRLRRGDVDLGMGGGPDILRAAYGQVQEDGRLRVFVGDAYLMLVRWDAEGNVTAESIHQYGSNTTHEDSPHYADQAPLTVQQQLKPVWYNEADIRTNLEQEYRPGEEQPD
ncbi:MAG: acylase [Chloroflexi bacterium]|nr:acylase [Chloroflexota bacterium]